MTEDRNLLERQMERVELRPFTLDGFHRQRSRKQRNRRIGTALVALLVAGAAIGMLVRSFSTSHAPADDRSDDLGIFAPVAGRIVFENENDRGYDRGPGPSTRADPPTRMRGRASQMTSPRRWCHWTSRTSRASRSAP